MKYNYYSKDSILGIDGQLHWVGEEIASDYYRSVWREEYSERMRNAPVKRLDANGKTMEFDDQASSRECSLDVVIEAGGEHHLGSFENIEDAVLDHLEKDERITILIELLPSLDAEEQRMLQAIADGMSSRAYEREYHVNHKTMLYRREKLIRKLRNMVLAEEKRRAEARAVEFK